MRSAYGKKMRPEREKMYNRIKKAKNAQIWISAVLYILITALVLVIILEALSPVLENMKDKSIYVRTRDTFLSLSQHIKDVSQEGQGAQRIVNIEIQKGTFGIEENTVKWKMDTEADILEPRTTVTLGNVFLVANGEVDAFETNDSLILENSRFAVAFLKIGSETNFSNYTTTDLIKNITFKETGATFNPNYNFYVDDNTATNTGNGYTKLLTKGRDLGSASLLAHMNSSSKEYELVFTLESQADYVLVKLQQVMG